MARRRVSGIAAQIRQSITSIAILLSIPVVIGLVTMVVYSTRYEAMIRRRTFFPWRPGGLPLRRAAPRS